MHPHRGYYVGINSSMLRPRYIIYGYAGTWSLRGRFQRTQQFGVWRGLYYRGPARSAFSLVPLRAYIRDLSVRVVQGLDLMRYELGLERFQKDP